MLESFNKNFENSLGILLINTPVELKDTEVFIIPDEILNDLENNIKENPDLDNFLDQGIIYYTSQDCESDKMMASFNNTKVTPLYLGEFDKSYDKEVIEQYFELVHSIDNNHEYNTDKPSIGMWRVKKECLKNMVSLCIAKDSYNGGRYGPTLTYNAEESKRSILERYNANSKILNKDLEIHLQDLYSLMVSSHKLYTNNDDPETKDMIFDLQIPAYLTDNLPVAFEEGIDINGPYSFDLGLTNFTIGTGSIFDHELADLVPLDLRLYK